MKKKLKNKINILKYFRCLKIKKIKKFSLRDKNI